MKNWNYFEKLRIKGIKALRKAGHKAENTGERKRVRRRFNKIDESKYRELDIKLIGSYRDWLSKNAPQDDDTGNYIEPLAANPDSASGALDIENGIM